MNRARPHLKSNLKFVYSDNDSLSVIFQDNNILMGVVGEFNKNLKELEKLEQLELAWLQIVVCIAIQLPA